MKANQETNQDQGGNGSVQPIAGDQKQSKVIMWIVIAVVIGAIGAILFF